MKLELTENDVLMLKIAGSALIAFLIVRFLLMPGIERFQENTLERDLLDERVSEMELSIESIPVLEEAAEIRMKELMEISASYYEKMENRQVDELLTGLALKHGLFPVSLSIDGAKPTLPEPYLYGVTANAEGEVSDNYICTATGRMVLQGEENRIFAFLDDVEENYPAIMLRSLHRQEQVYFDAEWNTVEQPNVSCELAVYMYDAGTLAHSLQEESTGREGS